MTGTLLRAAIEDRRQAQQNGATRMTNSEAANTIEDLLGMLVLDEYERDALRADVVICGCQVGLKLRRRRLFETSWHPLILMPPCYHTEPVVSVVGHGTPTWVRERLGFNPTIHDYREAMGISWMNRGELSQAIPPAYTKLIGENLMTAIQHQEPAPVANPCPSDALYAGFKTSKAVGPAELVRQVRALHPNAVLCCGPDIIAAVGEAEDLVAFARAREGQIFVKVGR